MLVKQQMALNTDFLDPTDNILEQKSPTGTFEKTGLNTINPDIEHKEIALPATKKRPMSVNHHGGHRKNKHSFNPPPKGESALNLNYLGSQSFGIMPITRPSSSVNRY